jgi:hypothetical protein
MMMSSSPVRQRVGVGRVASSTHPASAVSATVAAVARAAAAAVESV